METNWGCQEFKGGIYRDWHACTQLQWWAYLYACIMCMCICILCIWLQSFTIQWDFKGSIYWDEKVETCRDISRAVEFWGNTGGVEQGGKGQCMRAQYTIPEREGGLHFWPWPFLPCFWLIVQACAEILEAQYLVHTLLIIKLRRICSIPCASACFRCRAQWLKFIHSPLNHLSLQLARDPNHTELAEGMSSMT